GDALAETGLPLNFAEQFFNLSSGEKEALERAKNSEIEMLRRREEIAELEKKARTKHIAVKNMGVGLLIAGVITLLISKFVLWLLITGGLLVLFGLGLLVKFKLAQIENMAPVHAERKNLEKQEAIFNQLRSNIKVISKKLGIENPDELLRITRESGEQLHKLGTYHDEMVALKQREKSLLDEIRAEFLALGYKTPGELNQAYLSGINDRLEQALQLRVESAELEEDIRQVKDDMERAREDLKSARDEAMAILKSAGINEPIPGGFRTFEDELKMSEEWWDWKKEFENTKKQILSESERSHLEDRLKNLEPIPDSVESLALEHGFPPDASPEEYEKIEKEIEARSEALREERSRIQKEILVTMESLKSIPDLKEELEIKKRYHEKAKSFKAAVEEAISVMENISGNLMSSWARDLNDLVGKILQHFAPTLSGLQFNRDLSFSFHKGDEKKLFKSTDKAGLPLSRGTFDQLYLSIRLAICKFLSGQVKLPVILDEPFAHADEERFISGMNALNEISKTYGQIIILSCHRLRYERWIKENSPQVNLLDFDRMITTSAY
ncbi:MAG: hypothetical protein J7M18_01950, partial [Candidatus Eremiobacteraeota bacterium]|nr:hypothetical protein [Candidatus Eremiobacteraeota bacterium]